MKIIVAAIGKEKDFAGYDLVSEYCERISHYAPCEFRYLPSGDEKEENKRIVEMLDKEGPGSYAIALDEKGKELDSRGFADLIQSRMNESVRSLVFIIGGAYGLSHEVRRRANAVIALSKMTFPHGLVRLILAEQIYRACTIVRGEKYHH